MKHIFISLFFLTLSIFLTAQKTTRQEYINKYKKDAVDEMNKSGVPASITLAQGILESSDGNSSLAIKANNHFGIKCHKEWTGDTIIQDDDQKNECFRKYKTVYDSYVDHSKFLKERPRYSFLFSLPITDYKGWSKGLKQAGYATNPSYAELLIKIIEENKLYELDKLYKKGNSLPNTEVNQVIAGREVLKNNGVSYVVALKGDTYFRIAEEFEMMLWQLYKYNDSDKNSKIQEGNMIYLQPKRRKSKTNNEHVVKQGENLIFISQKYAVKLSSLIKMNQISIEQSLSVGSVIKLK